jgi:hypothetical protein
MSFLNSAGFGASGPTSGVLAALLACARADAGRARLAPAAAALSTMLLRVVFLNIAFLQSN